MNQEPQCRYGRLNGRCAMNPAWCGLAERHIRVPTRPTRLPADKLSDGNWADLRMAEMFDGHSRQTLQRLVRESAWMRRAARATRATPVDLTAAQVLAVMALEGSVTFEGTRARLGLTKEQMSRALRSLRLKRSDRRSPGPLLPRSVAECDASGSRSPGRPDRPTHVTLSAVAGSPP